MNARDDGMERNGWTRRFVVVRDRASEFVEMYRAMGYEVRLEPLDPEQLPASECGDCVQVTCAGCVVIYTRRREENGERRAPT